MNKRTLKRTFLLVCILVCQGAQGAAITRSQPSLQILFHKESDYKAFLLAQDVVNKAMGRPQVMVLVDAAEKAQQEEKRAKLAEDARQKEKAYQASLKQAQQELAQEQERNRAEEYEQKERAERLQQEREQEQRFAMLLQRIESGGLGFLGNFRFSEQPHSQEHKAAKGDIDRRSTLLPAGALSLFNALHHTLSARK